MKYRNGLFLGMALVLAIGTHALAGSVAGTKEDTEKGFSLFTTVLEQVRTGNVQGAMETAAGISHNSLKTAAYYNIGAAQAKAGNRAGVDKTVEQILQTTASAQSDTERMNALVCALVPVGAAQAKAGDRVGAAKTFAKALWAADLLQEPDKGKDQVLRRIAVEQASAGDIQGAMQTFVGIQRENDKGWVLKAIVKAQVKAAEGILERTDAEKAQTASTKP